jgi:hypothetical protein
MQNTQSGALRSFTMITIRQQEKTRTFISDPQTLYKLHARRQKRLISYRKGNRT